MHHTITRTLIYTLCISLLINTSSSAAQNEEAQQLADQIAPFMTDTAIAVVSVNLEKADLATNRESLATLINYFQSESQVGVTFFELLGELKQHGVTNVCYVIDPLEASHSWGYVLVPNPGDKLSDDDHGGRLIDSVWISGSDRVTTFFQEGTRGPARPMLKNALAQHMGAGFQFAVTPSDDQRRILREMLPDLAGEYGTVTGAQLANGFSYLSAGWNDANSFHLRMQTKDQAHAKQWQQVCAGAMHDIASIERVQQKAPSLQAALEKLIPKLDDSALTISPDQTSELTSNAMKQAIATAREDLFRRETMNQMKQLGLAFHNFHERYKSFPPAASYDQDGKPLLSWRVYLLPYLEQDALYQEFHLDEPWDSQHNKALVEKMPEIYKCPRTPTDPGMTVFQVATGKDLLFGGKAGTPIAKMSDGTSNTILAFDTTADQAVPWTKPDDLEIDPENPKHGLLDGREYFITLFGEGSARVIPEKVSNETLMKLLTPAGGEVIPQDEYP